LCESDPQFSGFLSGETLPAPACLRQRIKADLGKFYDHLPGEVANHLENGDVGRAAALPPHLHDDRDPVEVLKEKVNQIREPALTAGEDSPKDGRKGRVLVPSTRLTQRHEVTLRPPTRRREQ
jgi:hypothetical protein